MALQKMVCSFDPLKQVESRRFLCLIICSLCCSHETLRPPHHLHFPSLNHTLLLYSHSSHLFPLRFPALSDRFLRSHFGLLSVRKVTISCFSRGFPSLSLGSHLCHFSYRVVSSISICHHYLKSSKCSRFRKPS